MGTPGTCRAMRAASTASGPTSLPPKPPPTNWAMMWTLSAGSLRASATESRKTKGDWVEDHTVMRSPSHLATDTWGSSVAWLS